MIFTLIHLKGSVTLLIISCRVQGSTWIVATAQLPTHKVWLLITELITTTLVVICDHTPKSIYHTVMLACTLGHNSACQFEHFLIGIHVLMNAAKCQYRDHSLSSLSYHSSRIMLIWISELRYLKFKDQCPGIACDWPVIHNIGWPLNFSNQMGIDHYH